MEQEIVLIGSIALGALAGGGLPWRLLQIVMGLRAPSAGRQPLSLGDRSTYLIFGLAMFGMGLVELYLGFRYGEMFWSRTRDGSPGAWLAYDDNKRAFALMGFLFTFAMFLGAGIVVMALFDKRLSARR
jgi:hypothetical protein